MVLHYWEKDRYMDGLHSKACFLALCHIQNVECNHISFLNGMELLEQFFHCK